MERLQKFLAAAGIASRRSCEEIIRAGRVKLNNKIVTAMGVKIDPEKDIIMVDDRIVGQKERNIYLLLYKPCGYITTVKDPQSRKTVVELIGNISERVYPVGRLDYDTSGLLLMTNDGNLTNRLIHPSNEVDKTYNVLVKGKCSSSSLEMLQRGVILDDGITAPAGVRIIKLFKDATLLEMTIHEGRNRQIRRMCGAVGHHVLELTRIKFGPLTLDGLQPGEFRFLTAKEINRLKKIY